jgi:hypothetical protein
MSDWTPIIVTAIICVTVIAVSAIVSNNNKGGK